MNILKPLSNDYYNVGKGAIFAFLEGERRGHRLGDPESLSFSIDETEEPIYSNEEDVKTQVGTLTSERTVNVTARIRQLSPIVRAIAVNGEVDSINQAESLGMMETFEQPGIYDLNALGIIVKSVTAGGVPAVKGLPENGGHYTIDERSGLIETYVPDVDIEYDVPAISNRFATGIASGNGMTVKLVYVGTNRQGVRSKVVVHRLKMKGNGREFISDSEIQVVEITGVASPVAGYAPGYEIGFEQDLPRIGQNFDEAA